jgi:hypothetical protein
MERFRDLEINEDAEFHDREWTAERFGWLALFLLILLATLGLFGHGPLSWTSSTSPDGTLEASFERFGRRGGTQSLVVRADAAAATDGTFLVDVTGDYASAVQFDTITPQPDSAEPVRDGIRYTFTQAQPEAGLEVTFSLTPDSLWGVTGEMALAGQEPLSIDQFFFP